MVDSVPKFDSLPDPLRDRQVSTLEPPPNKPLDTKYLFPYTGIIILTLNRLITHINRS